MWNSNLPEKPGVYLTYGSVLGITTCMYFGNGKWALQGITKYIELPNPPEK